MTILFRPAVRNIGAPLLGALLLITGCDGEDDPLEPGAQGTIEVSVVLEGSAVSDIQVILRDRSTGENVATRSTGPDGTVRFEEVVPGPYRVIPVISGLWVATLAEPVGGKIQVTPGATVFASFRFREA